MANGASCAASHTWTSVGPESPIFVSVGFLSVMNLKRKLKQVTPTEELKFALLCLESSFSRSVKCSERFVIKRGKKVSCFEDRIKKINRLRRLWEGSAVS